MNTMQRCKKKAGIAVLIAYKVNFKARNNTRDRGAFQMIKGWILKEDMTFLYLFDPNRTSSKYIKQI